MPTGCYTVVCLQPLTVLPGVMLTNETDNVVALSSGSASVEFTYPTGVPRGTNDLVFVTESGMWSGTPATYSWTKAFVRLYGEWLAFSCTSGDRLPPGEYRFEHLQPYLGKHIVVHTTLSADEHKIIAF